METKAEIFISYQDGKIKGHIEGTIGDLIKGLGSIFENRESHLQLLKHAIEISKNITDKEFKNDCKFHLQSDDNRTNLQTSGYYEDIALLIANYIRNDKKLLEIIEDAIKAYEAFLIYKELNKNRDYILERMSKANDSYEAFEIILNEVEKLREKHNPVNRENDDILKVINDFKNGQTKPD